MVLLTLGKLVTSFFQKALKYSTRVTFLLNLFHYRMKMVGSKASSFDHRASNRSDFNMKLTKLNSTLIYLENLK